jgi:DNA-binding transcriptional ArsR family regulator
MELHLSTLFINNESGQGRKYRGGTMEACRLVIYRTGVRQMADEFKMPRRVVHKELGVPVPASGDPEKQKKIDDEKLLRVLAEDYRVNPGLHMSREDIRESFDVEEGKLDETLLSLEKKGLVKLYRDKKGIALAKATYEGLSKANPPEYYRWFPQWVEKENIF